MADLLISVVFGILNFLASIFITPLVTFFTNVIPDISNLFTGILALINYGLTYMGFIVNLLMIPKSLIVLLITLTIGIFGVDLAVRGISLAMAVYHYFKP